MPCTTSLTQANSLNGSTRNRGPIFLQTWKARSNALNLIIQTSSQRTIARPVLAPAIPTVVGNDARERRHCGPSHPFPQGRIDRCIACRPTPSRLAPSVPVDRHRLHSIAREGGYSGVVVYLAARDRATGDEVLKCLLGRRPGVPPPSSQVCPFSGASMPNSPTSWEPNLTVSPSTT